MSKLSADKAKHFWQQARQRAADENADFSGECFPEDPDAKGFSGITFHGDALFERATFEGDAYFCDCMVEGHLGLSWANFREKADFHAARLSTSHYGSIEFRGTTFGGIAYFARTAFLGPAYFHEAQFQDTVGFRLAEFAAETLFCKAHFRRSAEFQGARFKDYTDFEGATFMEVASFVRVVFGARASFRCATFEGRTFFGGVETQSLLDFSLPSEQTRPFSLPEHGETAYRAAKRAAQDVADYRSAGNYHYAEQCAIDSRQRREAWEIVKKRRCQGVKALAYTWGEFLFGRLVFGYGERPWRPLLIGLGMILLWAVFFWVGGVVAPVANAGSPEIVHGWWQSLYFSIVTFTTLGYGDLRPPEHLRLLAATEAFLGAALMALFIVALARKFTR